MLRLDAEAWLLALSQSSLETLQLRFAHAAFVRSLAAAALLAGYFVELLRDRLAFVELGDRMLLGNCLVMSRSPSAALWGLLIGSALLTLTP